MDTIYALASGQGKAGIAVIRLSGPAADETVQALAGPLPAFRKAVLRKLRNPEGHVLDEALVLRFAEGGSFTGEPSAEFHLHGSRATIAAVLRTLGARTGHRIAMPGEFTRRALENGRLDLTEVEGLADLIDAETEAQRRQALRLMSGALGEAADRWRRDLLRAMALLTATIDFVDEDVPVDVAPEVRELLSAVATDLNRELAGYKAAERVREGFEVAILGAPNVGKSTLLNALAGRDAALTSEIAGTTRDVIEVRMEIEGLPVTFLDTAGLRETSDPVERLGIARAVKRAGSADLRVILVEAGVPIGLKPCAGDLVVRAKADGRAGTDLAVSGRTGSGVAELLTAIAARLIPIANAAGNAVQERQRLAIAEAVEHVAHACGGLTTDLWEAELISELVRRAIQALDVLIGRVDVEDVLGAVFASFCIGK